MTCWSPILQENGSQCFGGDEPLIPSLHFWIQLPETNRSTAIQKENGRNSETKTPVKKITSSCIVYQLQAKWCLCGFYQAAWCSYVRSASIIPDSWGSVLPKQHSCKSLKAVLHALTVIHEHTNKKQRGGTIMYALFPEHLLQKTLLSSLQTKRFTISAIRLIFQTKGDIFISS